MYKVMLLRRLLILACGMISIVDSGCATVVATVSAVEGVVGVVVVVVVAVRRVVVEASVDSRAVLEDACVTVEVEVD